MASPWDFLGQVARKNGHTALLLDITQNRKTVDMHTELTRFFVGK
jgi:hypothetical protein